MERPPKQPLETQDIFIWDYEKSQPQKGYRKDVAKLPTVYELKKTAGSTTNEAPDSDTIIDIEKAEAVAIQADTLDPNNTCTSLDVNVMASLDGATWDTTPYAEMNLGDAERKTMLINPGPLKIRIRFDTNNNAGYPRVLVKVRE